MKLSIVIPVRNEHATVVALIARVRAVDCGMPKEMIVVDGASTDGTREALLALPAADDLILVLEDAAHGKGRAVRTGFERATGDIVMVQDADLELDPGEIPSLLAPILEDGQTVVLGGLSDSERATSHGGVPFLSSIPLIGGLFGHASRQSTETELFIFLTPRVIRNDEDAERLTMPFRAKANRVSP